MEYEVRCEVSEIVTHDQLNSYFKNGRYEDTYEYVFRTLFQREPKNRDISLSKLERVFSSEVEEKIYDDISDDDEFIQYMEELTSKKKGRGKEEQGEKRSFKYIDEDDEEDIKRAKDRLEDLRSFRVFNQNKEELDYQMRIANDILRKQNKDFIIEEMYKYLRTLDPKIDMEKITKEYDLNINDKKIHSIIKTIKDMIDSQMEHLKYSSSPCFMYRIESFHNDVHYGSIFVFYDPKNRNDQGEKYTMIQEITKYGIPILCQLLFKNYAKYIPRLNSVLLPAINDVSRKLHAKVIYVHPLKDQARQMEQHYGFLKTNYVWEMPCNGIALTFDNTSRYYKKVEY